MDRPSFVRKDLLKIVRSFSFFHSSFFLLFPVSHFLLQ